MKLSFLLSEECILTGFDSAERPRERILAELLDALYDRTSLKDEEVSKQALLRDLITREREMATGLGQGLAFPHARLEKLSKSYTLLGICPEGTEFQSLDQKPVNFFVVSVIPLDEASQLLLNRAAIVRFLSSAENRRALLAAADSRAAWEVIDHSGIVIDRNILARDIMCPQVGSVAPDATLDEAARALHKYHCDSLPILDEDGHFLGDISCFELFSQGLPDFFANLHTISFVRNMDPFEKYFERDSKIRLNELTFQRKSPTISADATLMEVIFELATRNKELLYVVAEDRRLLGIIDRYSVVDKILVRV